MELTTYDTQKKLTVNSDIFDYSYNEGLVHQAIVTYMNNARSGTVGDGTFTKLGRIEQELILVIATGLQISRIQGARPAVGGLRLTRKQTA